jgi:outer membrane lipoprotein SlyB
MPTRTRSLFVLTAVLIAASGCANRQLVTSSVMRDIQARDPKLTKIRVYPAVTFVVVHTKALGDDVRVSGQAGTVREDIRGRRVEVEVNRTRPGAIVAVETLEGQPALWVTFDDECTVRDCAFGFVRTEDGKYRLFHVPLLPGYSEPAVFRKRIAPNKAMEKTRIFSKSKGASVYFTMRGQIASIALEVKKQKRVEIETVKDTKKGVRPGG